MFCGKIQYLSKKVVNIFIEKFSIRFQEHMIAETQNAMVCTIFWPKLNGVNYALKLAMKSFAQCLVWVSDRT